MTVDAARLEARATLRPRLVVQVGDDFRLENCLVA